MASYSTADAIWLGIGFLGQAAFTSRFLVQWLASERERNSVVPAAFHVPAASTPGMCVPGPGTPRNHVHASSVSCTRVMCSRSMRRFPRWNVDARSIGDSTTSSCV